MWSPLKTYFSKDGKHQSSDIKDGSHCFVLSFVFKECICLQEMSLVNTCSD